MKLRPATCGRRSPNVLVDRNFVAKLADVALPRQGRHPPLGTAFWMSPECLLGLPNTAAADIYSYGVVVYECLTRRAPYSDEEAEDPGALAAIAAGKRRLPLPPGCSFALVALMNECLHFDPAKRPGAGEIGRRLSALDPAEVASPVFVDPDGASSGIGWRRPSCTVKNRRSSDSIMFSLFPREVADALLRGEKVPPESKGMVTMYFRSDVVSIACHVYFVPHFFDRRFL